MNKSESLKELAPALVAAQSELQNPSLDATNPHFKSKFASLANVRNTITKVFCKHGLAIVQNISSTDRAVGCSTMILHKSGEWMETDQLFLPATKLDAQGFGSASTYARRYSEQAAANVVGDDDDDGNGAQQKPQQATEKNSVAIPANAEGKEIWEKLDDEERKFLTDILTVIQDKCKENLFDEAGQFFYVGAHIDQEEQLAVWSRLSVSERKMIRKFKPEQK